MNPGALLVAVTALGLLEAAWFALGPPPGERLRPLVDLLAWEGLALGLFGAFLAADRPFLAVRALRRRSRGEDPVDPSASPKPERAFGAATLGAGLVFFATSAGLWAVWGRP